MIVVGDTISTDEVTVVQSLPDYDTFMQLLKDRADEVKSSFDQTDNVLSSYTYREACNAYGNNAVNEINAFVASNGIKMLDDQPTAFADWSRFEAVHTPAATQYMPTRIGKSGTGYVIYAPVDFWLNTRYLHIVNTGVRVILSPNSDLYGTITDIGSYAFNIVSTTVDATQTGEIKLKLLPLVSGDIMIKAGTPLARIHFSHSTKLLSDNVRKFTFINDEYEVKGEENVEEIEAVVE